LLGASVGVPYLASHSSNDGKGVSNLWSTATAASAPQVVAAVPGAPPAVGIPSQPAMPGAAGATSTAPTPIDGMQFQSVEQILRFDVTKEWVYRHWSRKSTGPTDVGLFSVRVPLVMSQPTGLTGALTYFFNSYDQVEHISFRGRTGDSTQLFQFLTRYYQFQRVDAPIGEQIYRVGSGDKIQSELRTRPEGVLTANSSHNGIAVELELARPGSPRFLPPRPSRLQIPPVPAAPPSTPHAAAAPPASSSPATTGSWTDTAKSAGNSVKSAVGSYFDRARYATPQEEGQVLWKRWPN
jgi:hypothetical protein